jgi:hypothetical protein
MAYYSTSQVARMSGLNPNGISREIWNGWLDPPQQQSPKQMFLWTDKDVHRAPWVLQRRNAGGVLATNSGRPEA